MLPKLKAVFYSQPGSIPPSQPVRDWLKRLPRAERLEIGSDIQAVQFGWPLVVRFSKTVTNKTDGFFRMARREEAS